MSRADLLEDLRYARRLMKRYKKAPARKRTSMTWDFLMAQGHVRSAEVRGRGDGLATGGRIYVKGAVYEFGLPYRKRVDWRRTR